MRDLLTFLGESPSRFHAVENLRQTLEQEGYTPTEDGEDYIRRNANEFSYQFSTPAQPQEEPGMAMQ